MNISHDDVTTAYRSFLRSQRPSSRIDCPEIEELWGLFGKRTRERTKSKLLGHIMRCSYCYEDFLSLLEIRRSMSNLESEIELSRDLHIPANKTGERMGHTAMPGRKRSQFAFLAAGGSIIAAALFIFFYIVPLPQRGPDLIRDRPQIGIALIEPASCSSLRRGELRFRWEKKGLVDAYVLELFDSSLARIWRSDVLIEPGFVFPLTFLAALSSGKPYFWMVTGYDQNGRTVESALYGFKILD